MSSTGLCSFRGKHNNNYFCTLNKKYQKKLILYGSNKHDLDLFIVLKLFIPLIENFIYAHAKKNLG